MVSNTGHYEPVAREGFVFIIPAGIISFLTWWAGLPWVSLFFMGLAVCIVFFFRNPERHPPSDEHAVLSPADGTVVEVLDETVSENFQLPGLRRISIFMSIFNTHVNRIPVSGMIEKKVHVAGIFLDAREPRSSLLNERNSLIIKGEQGLIEVVQIAGKVARRIVCWVRPGDAVRKGERFGLIRFGSRLDVYLPGGYDIVVGVGMRVKAGETIIARVNELYKAVTTDGYGKS